MNEPSYGISIIKEYDESIFYHLSCDCLTPEHTYVMELEFDDECGDLRLNIWSEMAVHSLYDNNWFIHQWNKIKGIWNIIFGIPLIYSSDLGITSEKHINDFIEALEYGKDKIKKFKEPKDGSKESSGDRG